MNKHFSILLLLLLTFENISSQAVGVGKCAVAPVIPNFNASLYTGIWYEITKIPVIYETGLSCVTATYGFFNSSYITVRNTGYNKVLKRNSVTDGFAVSKNSSTPNYLIVTFPMNILGIKFQTAGNYNVWQTDYSTYSVVYSCNNVLTLPFGLSFKSESLWILSRNTTLNPTITSNIISILNSAGVNVKSLQKADQASCSQFYPPIVPVPTM